MSTQNAFNTALGELVKNELSVHLIGGAELKGTVSVVGDGFLVISGSNNFTKALVPMSAVLYVSDSGAKAVARLRASTTPST